MIFRFAVFLLLVPGFPGQAQTARNSARSITISDDRMRSMVQEIGFEFTEDSAGGVTVFAFPLDGRLVTLSNRVSSIELSACFEGFFDLLKANQWNREHFSSGAYRDEKGCTALRAELYFGGGVTSEMIKEFIDQFCTEVAIFSRTAAGLADAVPSADRVTSPIGTMAWSQWGPYRKLTAPRPATTPSVRGLLNITRKISLKYDPENWKQTASGDDGHYAFSLSSGGAQALVIAESSATPLGAVQDVALANAQLLDPHATFIFRGQRRVNGASVWLLKIEAEVDAVPTVYCGYFYSDTDGTVQVVAYSEKSQFPEYEKVLMDFLNGFTVLI